MALVNDPAPVPSVVLLLDTVGFVDVDQHTPRAVTKSPPAEVTEPPLAAPAEVIPDIAVVVTVTGVVNTWFAPYAVPALFVAYART